MPPRVEFDDINTFFQVDLGGTAVPYIHKIGMGKEIWGLVGEDDQLFTIIRYDNSPLGELDVHYVAGFELERLYYNAEGELVFWQVEMDLVLKKLIEDHVEMVDFNGFVDEYDQFQDEHGALFRFDVDLKNKSVSLVRVVGDKEQSMCKQSISDMATTIGLRLYEEEVDFYVDINNGSVVIGIVTSDEENTFLGYVRKLKGAVSLLDKKNIVELNPQVAWDVVDEL